VIDGNKLQAARDFLLKENVVSFVDDMDASFPARFAKAMRDVPKWAHERNAGVRPVLGAKKGSESAT